MKLRSITTLVLAVSLAGCVGLVPPTEVVRFTSDKAKLTFEKRGCELGRGQFTDLTGKGNPGMFVKFIAVSKEGNTVGQWYASCRAVIANGTSTCAIMGPQKARYECGNYDSFRIVQ